MQRTREIIPTRYERGIRSPDDARRKAGDLQNRGRAFTYRQPGWWCSLTDLDDIEGQLVDDDNQIAEMARRTAKAITHGEKVFVPVVIRAIRQRCGLTQREAGLLFGTGEKSFEKYESGEIQPSAPTKRLLKLAMEKPELFQNPPAAIRACRRLPTPSSCARHCAPRRSIGFTSACLRRRDRWSRARPLA